jgi:hypothetical protein
VGAQVAEAAPPPVEREIVTDLLRRGAMVAPVLLLASTLIWGRSGALSSAYALGLVLLNFALSAAVLSRASRMSPNTIMAAVLGGFLVRMTFVAVAIAVVHDMSWVSRAPLAITVVATHLGLLIWETRYLSISLAFPALKPRGES